MEGISQYTNVLAKQLRDHHRANLIHSAIAMKRAGVYAGSFHCSTDVVGGWWSVRINDGLITIQASDDGNNASQKIGGVVRNEVNGGTIHVSMANGDTDAFDSNGDLYIIGGTITVEGPSPSTPSVQRN